MKEFNLFVNIKTEDGNSFVSHHSFISDKDEAVARTLPTNGQRQMAHSLFIEALRRESFLQAILADDSSNVELWQQAKDEETKKQLEAQMSERVITFFIKALHKMAPLVMREVLDLITSQEFVDSPRPPKEKG